MIGVFALGSGIGHVPQDGGFLGGRGQDVPEVGAAGVARADADEEGVGFGRGVDPFHDFFEDGEGGVVKTFVVA